MVTIVGIALVLVVFVLLAVALVFPKVHPEHMMTPAEEARYELHPTLLPQPLVITSENVRDVINDSIETGIEHPALKLRKGTSDEDFMKFALEA